MKKLVLSVTLFLACSIASPATDMNCLTSALVNFNVSDPQWESLGTITVREFENYGYYDREATLYIKSISNKYFYKIKVGDKEYAVTTNPSYKKGFESKSDYKYKAGNYYFNM